MLVITCHDAPEEVTNRCSKKRCAICPYSKATISKDCRSFKLEVPIEEADETFINKTDIFTFVRVGEDGWQLFENDEEQFLCLDTLGVLEWLCYKDYTVIEETIL